jgi:hypothetical protein
MFQRAGGELERGRLALYEEMGEEGVDLYNPVIVFWLIVNLSARLSERGLPGALAREADGIRRPPGRPSRPGDLKLRRSISYNRISSVPAVSVVVSKLMRAFRQGDREAGDALAGVFDAELRRLAASKMKGERSAHTGSRRTWCTNSICNW